MNWISVEDRLPEEDDVYLCHFNDGTIETFSFDGEDRVRGNWGVDGFLGSESSWVTHWMPLPEPPETDQ